MMSYSGRLLQQRTALPPRTLAGGSVRLCPPRGSRAGGNKQFLTAPSQATSRPQAAWYIEQCGHSLAAQQRGSSVLVCQPRRELQGPGCGCDHVLGCTHTISRASASRPPPPAVRQLAASGGVAGRVLRNVTINSGFCAAPDTMDTLQHWAEDDFLPYGPLGMDFPFPVAMPTAGCLPQYGAPSDYLGAELMNGFHARDSTSTNQSSSNLRSDGSGRGCASGLSLDAALAAGPSHNLQHHQHMPPFEPMSGVAQAKHMPTGRVPAAEDVAPPNEQQGKASQKRFRQRQKERMSSLEQEVRHHRGSGPHVREACLCTVPFASQLPGRAISASCTPHCSWTRPRPAGMPAFPHLLDACFSACCSWKPRRRSSGSWMLRTKC